MAKVSGARGPEAGDHFTDAGKVTEGGRWGTQSVDDYRLTPGDHLLGSQEVIIFADVRNKPGQAADSGGRAQARGTHF